MKQKYCLLRDLEAFTPDKPVFCLWVGSSKRDQVRKALLDSFCCDMGFFFRVWDSSTDFELLTRSKEFFPESNLSLCRLHRVDMSIAEFYSKLMRGNLEAIEAEAKQPKGVFRLLSMLDYNFERKHAKRSEKTQCQSSNRKYLKSTYLADWQTAAISFGLILVLIMLDAVVTNLFNFQ